jgi:hypothetical protein
MRCLLRPGACVAAAPVAADMQPGTDRTDRWEHGCKVIWRSPPSDTQTSGFSPNRTPLEHAAVVPPDSGRIHCGGESPARTSLEHACGRPRRPRRGGSRSPCLEAAMTARPLAPVIPSSASRLAGSAPGPPRAGHCRLLVRYRHHRFPSTWSTGSAASTPPGGPPTGPSAAGLHR